MKYAYVQGELLNSAVYINLLGTVLCMYA